MEAITDFLRNTTFLGMALGRLLLAFALILAGFIVRRVLGGCVLERLTRITKRTHTELDNLLVTAVRKPIEIAVVLAGIGFGISVLRLPTDPVNIQRFVSAILVLAVTIIAAWFLFRLVDAFATHFHTLARRTETKFDDALIPLFRKAFKVFLGVLAFVVAIQNMGYSVAGVLAGLGIGGLALALAAQDTVANFFGSIMILLDRPFKIGDWVKGSNFEGIVEEIGFRSTRIRTFPKTLVSVPNKEMANMIIDNQQAMPVRRVDLEVGVTYETTAAQMRQAVDGIKKVIGSLEGVWDEGSLVRFCDFGASSLNIKVRCFTLAKDYDTHSGVRQELLLRIMELLEELGLSIAFPSRTLYFAQGEAIRVRAEAGACAPPHPGKPDCPSLRQEAKERRGESGQ